MSTINIDKYLPTSFYFRNGVETFKCITRNKLIKKNKEELIRQAFVKYLIEELQVPIDSIAVEVPMSRFKSGAKGRADIIIYSSSEEGDEDAICIVECKDKEVYLSDKVRDQVFAYHDYLPVTFIMLTNGDELEVLFWNTEEEEFKELSKIPSYQEMVEKNNIVFEDVEFKTWRRPKFKNILNEKIVKKFIGEHIGEDTSKEYYSFIINLCGLLYDVTEKISPQILFGVNIIEDGELRYASFGNAAGGSYAGYYRYFIIQDEYGNHQVISLAIMANLKTVNHEKWGNNRGRSTFVVAIDDFEVSHNSLQLTIEDNVILKDNKAFLFHDGRLTVGHLGSVNKQRVIDFTKQHYPELVVDNKIFLGEFDLDSNILWKQRNTKIFLANTIKYALVRDKLRKEIKLKNSSLIKS
jgi:hypothetical protein